MIPAVVLLGAVTAERLAELWLAHRNTADLLAKGAREFAPSHYPAIVLLHAFWLAGLWRFGWMHPLSSFWLMIFLVLQVLRVWILMTLGDRWTTRIIVLPHAPLVTTGPYRFLSHPNYFVVIGEIAALPLCLGLPWFALIFSASNAIVLTVRVRAENAALIEAAVRHHQDRADRAERWLYQVSVEIEQKFFGRDDGRASQPPPPQALFRK